MIASAVSTGQACVGGMKLRVRKHKYVDQSNSGNVAQQGVQCMLKNEKKIKKLLIEISVFRSQLF